MNNQKEIKIEKNTLYSPVFVNDWEENFLYPLADWLNGMAFRDFSFSKSGKPIIKIAEIKNGISSQTKFTNEEYDEKYLLKKGDMLFCWSGQPETSIDIFWWDGPEGWLNQHIFKVTPKIENKKFFYYLLKYLKPNFIQIGINKQTTGLGHVTKRDLEKIIVKLPANKEQDKIAAVLSSLDDKIELLHAQNETLEKIAQRIFKEWFVNFKIDGKKLKLKNGVPEGWRVGKMSEGVKICGGTTPDTKNLEYWNGNINWTSPKDLSNCKEMFLTKTENKITEKGLSKIGSGLLPVKTLLLSSRAPIGYLALTNIPVAINQGYIAFLPDGFFTNEYMYLWLKLNMDKVVSSANGSTFLEISKTSFRNIEIIIPEKEVLNNFQTVIDPIFEKILNNINQIQTLSRLRDTLLPKLMSGGLKL